MITPIRMMTVSQIIARQDDLLMSADDVKTIAKNEKAKVINELINISHHCIDVSELRSTMIDMHNRLNENLKDERAKVIDEFVKRIEKNQTHHNSCTSPIEFDMSVDMTDILAIAEQMKEEL